MTLHSDNFSLPQTSFAVLGMLSFRPMSGYDLMQFAERSISHFYWNPAKSQIYAELRRLKDAGLVTEEHVEQESRPDKRVYTITGAGRAALSEWVAGAPFEKDVFKSVLMLRLFFGESAGPGALVRLLEQNLQHVRAQHDALLEMESRCLALDSPPLFSLLTIRGGIHMTTAAINWTTESLQSLRGRSDAGEPGDRDEAGGQ